MDDADLTTSPVTLILVGGVLLVLFIYLFRSSRKTLDRVAQPQRSLSYECVVTPVAKADAALRGKFPALAGITDESGIELVRFGLFNWGALDLTADQIEEPVTVAFPDGTTVLSAAFAETIKTDFAALEPLAIDGSRITFPKFEIAARGTVIFNFILRGPGTPHAVTGRIEGGVPIRRLS